MCITCGLAAAFLAACGGLIGDSPTLVAPAKVPAPKALARKNGQPQPAVKGIAEVKNQEPASQPAAIVRPADNRPEEKQAIKNKVSNIAKKTFSAATDTILAGLFFLLKLLAGLL